jgi:anti-sigma factor RsiW
MNHQPYEDWMHTTLEGALPLEQHRALHAHLSDCAHCQMRWDALTTAHRALEAAPMLAPRVGFTGRFKHRLRAQQRRPAWRWGALALGMGTIGTSAVIVPLGIALLLGLWRVAQQPGLPLTLVTTLHALAAPLNAVLSALVITLRGLTLPLALWLSLFTASGLATVWLYILRRAERKTLTRFS